MATNDQPRSLKDPLERERRNARLEEPHIAPLTAFVRAMRSEVGCGELIPFFDPADGGVEAECLFLLEAPGPKAVQSGFVSRDNPDETAKNFFLLNQAAGLERSRTVSWNIVPWYIGDGTRIRPPTPEELALGQVRLAELLVLLKRLRCVVLVGRKAQHAQQQVTRALPECVILSMVHPSPRVMNSDRSRWKTALASLEEVMEVMG